MLAAAVDDCCLTAENDLHLAWHNLTTEQSSYLHFSFFFSALFAAIKTKQYLSSERRAECKKGQASEWKK